VTCAGPLTFEQLGPRGLPHTSFNHELGIGRVVALEGRTLVVEFPRSGTRLRLASDTDALAPVDLGPGRPVRIVASRDETTIVERRPDGDVELANGQTVSPHALWPLELEGALLERLALGDVDDPADFQTRLDVLRLLSLREAAGLGPFFSADGSGCIRISCTWPSAQARATPCAGCSPTKSVWGRLSKRRSS
jgi:hypothetical protein